MVWEVPRCVTPPCFFFFTDTLLEAKLLACLNAVENDQLQLTNVSLREEHTVLSDSNTDRHCE